MAKPSDLLTVGDPEMFQVLFSQSSQSEGWSTVVSACEIYGIGCVVRVSNNIDGSLAENLTFVSGAIIVNDINGGRKLVQIGE